MPTKHTIDGRLAKLIMGQIDDIAATNQDVLFDLIEKIFGAHGHDAELRLALTALHNNGQISRIATLLRAGKLQECEQIVMGIKK